MSLFFCAEPSGLMREYKPSIECGEFSADVGERVGSRYIVHKELCSRRVQVDCSGTGDEVKELTDLAVKRGSLNRVHGDK